MSVSGGGKSAALRPRFIYSAVGLDVDHFKKFNDTCGYQRKEEVLRFRTNVMQRAGISEIGQSAPGEKKRAE
jgi:hypothetical protein